MGKVKIPREITDREIGCLENLVVAYNTVFLMSSIFIISIAGTAQELFSDFHRLLSPSIVLVIIGGFTVVVAAMGYIAVGKKSSTLMSTYTVLLTFVFVCEVIGGLGILSYRGEIKSVVTRKMKRAIFNYAEDPITANLVDYVQLELRCCGVSNYKDWNNTFTGPPIFPNCTQDKLVLPQSCCFRVNSTYQAVNPKGCLPTIHFMLYRSSLMLSTTVIAICVIQLLGAYFSYSLSSMLNKYKIQKLANSYPSQEQNQRPEIPVDYREKSNYF